MDYKRFASHGHDNPMSKDSVNRTLRSYPAKRDTWGFTKRRWNNRKKKLGELNEKSEALRKAKEAH